MQPITFHEHKIKLTGVDTRFCVAINVMQSMHVVRYYCMSRSYHCVHCAGEADNEQCLLHAEE